MDLLEPLTPKFSGGENKNTVAYLPHALAGKKSGLAVRKGTGGRWCPYTHKKQGVGFTGDYHFVSGASFICPSCPNYGNEFRKAIFEEIRYRASICCDSNCRL
jgi:hypothetical protein